MKKGWYREPARHSLAAKGIKTMRNVRKSIPLKTIKQSETRQWKCDNCGAWVDDDGSGNDHEGYTCDRCGSCMFPEELARFYADGDLEAKMIWRDGKKVKMPYKSSRSTLQWKPSDKRTINVTYDYVTPESAVDGAVEDSGYEEKDIQIESIDDIIGIFERYGHVEGDGNSYYTVDPDRDIHSGGETRYGIHLQNFTPDEINKIWKRLDKEKLVYVWGRKR